MSPAETPRRDRPHGREPPCVAPRLSQKRQGRSNVVVNRADLARQVNLPAGGAYPGVELKVLVSLQDFVKPSDTLKDLTAVRAVGDRIDEGVCASDTETRTTNSEPMLSDQGDCLCSTRFCPGARDEAPPNDV